MFKLKLTITHLAIFAAVVAVALALVYYKTSRMESRVTTKLKEMESFMMTMYATAATAPQPANEQAACFAAVPPPPVHQEPNRGKDIDDDAFSVSSEDVKEVLSSLDALEGAEQKQGETVEAATAPVSSQPVDDAYETELKKKSVDELKVMLKERNESTKGTKYELIKRLVALA